MPLPTHQRPCGDLFGGQQDHPEYDPAHPAGYETASTGFMMVGAREYDPEIGRFLQPDPQPTGPELQWGQLNRWAYCANDPVNASDPSGEFPWLLVLGAAALGGLIGYYIDGWRGAAIGAVVGGAAAALGAWAFAEALLGGGSAAVVVRGKYVFEGDRLIGTVIRDTGVIHCYNLVYREVLVRLLDGTTAVFRAEVWR